MISAKLNKLLKDLSIYKDVPTISVTIHLNNIPIAVPGVIVKGLFVLGIVSVAYHAKDLFRISLSFVNSVKCRIAHVFRRRVKNGAAVIYGATCKMGRAFALKFAIDGLPLILIDFSLDRLYKLREELIQINNDLDQSIKCCAMEEGINVKSMNNVWQILKEEKQITYFINCRNLKETAINLFHKQKLSNILFTSHYNLIIYTILLKKILKLMCENKCGNIICLNSTYKNEELLKRSHPLFFASSQFVLQLTRLMKLAYKDINFLQLNINCENITKNTKYLEIAEYSLSKLGLYDNINF